MLNTTSSDIICTKLDGTKKTIPFDKVAQVFKIRTMLDNGGDELDSIDDIPIYRAPRVRIIPESILPYKGKKCLILTQEIAQKHASEIKQILGDDSIRILYFKDNMLLEC